MSKDPALNPALHVKCNAYFVGLSSFEESEAPKPLQYELSDFQGASTSPVFSPDGKSAAVLSMATDGYEADKNQIFAIADIKKSSSVKLLNDGKAGPWDRSPQVCCTGSYCILTTADNASSPSPSATMVRHSTAQQKTQATVCYSPFHPTHQKPKANFPSN